MANGNGADSTTLELPMIDLPSSHACHQCGRCCTYLAIEIDSPSSFGDFENLHWYLTHKGISVYIDWEGDWFVEFETVCEHLSEQKTCGIYAERPKICSEFSWEECEVTTKESAWKFRFCDIDELRTWLKEKRPAVYERYRKGREKLISKREDSGNRTVVRRSRDAESQPRP